MPLWARGLAGSLSWNTHMRPLAKPRCDIYKKRSLTYPLKTSMEKTQGLTADMKAFKLEVNIKMRN